MPYINYENREISFKIVYYGPGMSGKTTNLAQIHRALQPQHRGEMIMLNTAEERTLFFDFFPLELGSVGGYRIRFNMYTVPGQVFYEASRKLILDGADAVVFVADSQPERLGDNLLSWELMRENLRAYDLQVSDFPVVLQYNKRDCPGALPLGTLEQRLELNGIPVFEAVATTGAGVLETIRRATQLVIERFQI